MTIGEQVRAGRVRRRLSQSEFADKLSVARWNHAGLCDKNMVSRWENGRREPREWAPYIEQVLSIDLRTGGEAVEDTQSGGDTVTGVMSLGGDDVNRRAFLTATAGAGLAALGVVDTEAVSRRVAKAGPVAVGMGEVNALRTMTGTLGDAASELGGGHARHLAVRYLTEDVRRWLDGRYTAQTGRELFAATAELVHLIGWMASDEGQTGLSQRYLVHSVRLADEAGEAELAATSLRGLADQALDLGHVPTALRLAQASEQRGKRLTNPKALSYYRTTLARAAAADGDKTTASAMLRAGEQAMGRAPERPGQSWASHYSAGRWAHDSGMIHARLGDLNAAQEHLHLALDIHGLDRRRTRAIVLADLGSVQLKRGDTAGALDTWAEFLDCSDGVSSRRVSDGLATVAARLDSVPGSPASEELRERVTARL